MDGGKESQVFTEQHFIIEAAQTHVTYRPLVSGEIEPETVGHFRNRDTFGAPVTIQDTVPGFAEAVCGGEPRRLKYEAPDGHWLAYEDEDRIAEFWIVHAGHELHVWCLRLNELSDRRATYEQQQYPQGDALHLDAAFGNYISTLNLELDALEKIKFYFGKFVDAAGEVHRQNFLDELCAIVNR